MAPNNPSKNIKRKRYSNSQKLEIVRLVNEPGSNVQRIARAEGLPESTIRTWIKNADVDEKNTDPSRNLTSQTISNDNDNNTNHMNNNNNKKRKTENRWTDIELKQLYNHIDIYGYNIQDYEQMKQLSNTSIKTRTPEQIRKKLVKLSNLNNNTNNNNNNNINNINTNNNDDSYIDNNYNDYNDFNQISDMANINNDNETTFLSQVNDDDNNKNTSEDNTLVRVGAWTNDEMKCLLDGIEICGRNNNRRHLAKEIATMIPSRTLKQIKKKLYDILKDEYNTNNDDDDSDKYHTGRWKDDEIQRLNNAIQKYGRTDTKKLSLAVRTRSMKQVRSLFYITAIGSSTKHHIMDDDGNNDNDSQHDDDDGVRKKGVVLSKIWNADELQRLNDAVKIHGIKDIKQLVKAVGTRNENQIRTLFQNINKTDQSSDQEVDHRNDQHGLSSNDKKGKSTSKSSISRKKWQMDEIDRLNYGIRQFGRDDIDSLERIVSTRTKQQIKDLFKNYNTGKSTYNICLGKDDDNNDIINVSAMTITESINNAIIIDTNNNDDLLEALAVAPEKVIEV